MAVRRRRPLFLLPRPRRNRDIPASSDRARSTPQPGEGDALPDGFVSASPVILSESKQNALIR